jgi:hypothetical protein
MVSKYVAFSESLPLWLKASFLVIVIYMAGVATPFLFKPKQTTSPASAATPPPPSAIKTDLPPPNDEPETLDGKAKKVFVTFFKRIGVAQPDIAMLLKYAEDIQAKEHMSYIKSLRVTLAGSGTGVLMRAEASGQATASVMAQLWEQHALAEKRLAWFEMGKD